MSIGYACILLGVPEISLKACTLRYANEEKLKHITLHNIWALSDMIDYNIRNGILLFRISSDIIPFGSHPVNQQQWWQDYGELLSGIGGKIRNSGIRVSMHPGQYTILNSPDNNVVERAVNDLLYHVRFLDALGVDRSHKIILHIGGVYGNKEKSIERFIENCNHLPGRIKRRLVLENDERCYNIDDVLTISDKTSLPVVFDNLHHSLNMPAEPFRSGISSSIPAAKLSPSWWIERCRSTWTPEDGRQKIHYSQQMDGGKPGAHSLTINTNEFLNFYSSISHLDVDIMLEVKDKNISAVNCIREIKENS